MTEPVTPQRPGADYHPGKFYTRASDENGHSKSVRTNIPKDWAPAIAKARDLFPTVYEFDAAFVRDAVFHRLVWLMQNHDSPALQAEMEGVLIDSEARRQAEQRDRWVKFIQNAEKRLSDLVADRYTAGLTVEIERLRVYAATLPEPYQTRALDLADSFQRSLALIDHS